MNLEIIQAGEKEYPIVLNLARFYVYDMAEHAGWPFDAEGSFEMGDQFNPFWQKPRPSRAWPANWTGIPFLARVDGDPAGFALVVRQGVSPDEYDMGEFFVARQYRRHDIGRKLATAMFDRFRGHWTVREMLTNKGAQAFWRRIIGDYTKGAFSDAEEVFPEHNNNREIVQRFDSAKA